VYSVFGRYSAAKCGVEKVMHLPSTRTEALLLSTLVVVMLVRHLAVNGAGWPEPLEIYTIVELLLRVAKRKP